MTPSPRAIVFGLVALAVLGLGATLALTRDSEPAVADTPVAAPSPTEPSEPASPTPAAVAPLTGVATDDAEVASRPTLAVKIENSSAARPQSGLDLADVVYEELTEGGVTRFIALFQSQVPDAIGPVRSGREVDAEVMPAYRGVLALSGARDDVVALIRRSGIPTIYDDGHGTHFYREPSRRSPHNLYATGEALFTAAADQAGPATPVWPFSDATPDGATVCAPSDTTCQDPGASLEVRMSGVSRTGWTYDGPAGVYRRAQDGQAHTVTGAGRIGAANVLVLATDVGPGPCCDPAGNPMTATRVTGTGSGVLLRDGQRYEITWSKATPADHYTILGPDGAPIAFKPGPTWVLLAPTEGVPGLR